jgi:hypothetical protein
MLKKPSYEEFLAVWEQAPSPEEMYASIFKNPDYCLIFAGNIIPGFVVYANSARTEGRGREEARAVCRSNSTAERLGKKIGVQGSDGDVRERQLFSINGEWYGPVILQEASEEDKKKDAADRLYKDVVRKALAAGLSSSDLDILKGRPTC